MATSTRLLPGATAPISKSLSTMKFIRISGPALEACTEEGRGAWKSRETERASNRREREREKDREGFSKCSVATAAAAKGLLAHDRRGHRSLRGF